MDLPLTHKMQMGIALIFTATVHMGGEGPVVFEEVSVVMFCLADV